MLCKSAVLTEMSGSLGGITAAKNRGGQYMRAKTQPLNPQTSRQGIVRAHLASVVAGWALLSDAQRTAWAALAENYPQANALGDLKKLPPLAYYVQTQTPRLDAGLTVKEDAPATGTAVQLSALTATADASDSHLVVTFATTDEWATAVGGALTIYASKPQPATVNFFKGPYTRLGTVLGAVSPPLSPSTQAYPYAAVAGQKVFFVARAVSADGRVSTPFRGVAVVAA